MPAHSCYFAQIRRNPDRKLLQYQQLPLLKAQLNRSGNQFLYTKHDNQLSQINIIMPAQHQNQQSKQYKAMSSFGSFQQN